MTLDSQYQQVPECLLEDMDGEMLLFNPANATTLHLNGPSAIVWELCTGENSVADIVEALQQAYPEQATQIEADVTSVITQLIEKQVIRRVDT